MKKITFNTSRDGGHYSPGVVHNGLLYVSGQLSIDPNSASKPSGDIVKETQQALKNLDRVLKAAGTTKDNIIQCRLYTPDVVYWDDINNVYSEYFGDHRPSRIIVPSNTLHGGCLVEIEAIAICQEAPNESI